MIIRVAGNTAVQRAGPWEGEAPADPTSSHGDGRAKFVLANGIVHLSEPGFDTNLGGGGSRRPNVIA